MKAYAKIICNDARFSRMISLELAAIGVETVSDFTNLDETYKLYIVADLDHAAIEELRELSYIAKIVGFASSYRVIDDEFENICSAILHRPFLTTEFLAQFDHSGLSPKESYDRGARTKRYQYLSTDPITKSAVWGDMRIPLSDYEFKILSVLCEKRGEAVDREYIRSLIGADNGNMGDVYICHLRRKLDHKLGLKLIYTVRGKGYMLKN